MATRPFFILGKKVLNHVYWHSSLSPAQSEEIQQHILKAETLSGLQQDIDYNVVKYNVQGQFLSLLWYPGFFTEAFPALKTSYHIDLIGKRVDKRGYQTSLNPPILHRKELLLSPDHPHSEQFRALTLTAEQLGLFENPLQIGFKQNFEKLIMEKGFQLVEQQFVPIGNLDSDEDNDITATQTTAVARHLTALSRSNLSAPMQCLARHGFLDGNLSVFDYGCGRGDDVRNLTANNIRAHGWDPYYAPEQTRQIADIVNLGFVINVIENASERVDALCGAYELTTTVLVVSAMLINQNTPKAQAFNDGVITQRHTFQKYYQQTELKAFISTTLKTETIAVAPGIFFVFKDKAAEQLFLLNRQRKPRNLLRLTQRLAVATPAKLSRHESKFQDLKHLLEPLWQQTLNLGRLPDKSEITEASELISNFGSISKALRFMLKHHDETSLEHARNHRVNELLVYFALQCFAKRQAYKQLDASLQRDIKAFFGDYACALKRAETCLYQISDAELIASNCLQATQQGLGYLDDEQALHVHSSTVLQLPLLLRIYIACGTLLYGDIEQTDLIKIHSRSGKLSLMRYDDFHNKPLPCLLERVKIKLREQDFDLYQYGDSFEPTYLYLKSRFINEESPHYAQQLNFDEQLQALMLVDFTGYGPKPDKFREVLANARYKIEGFDLKRSQTLPELDAPCGRYLRYRQLIECGATQQATGLANCPKKADSYTALYDLAIHVLDPVIDYFGMIDLTYGFCSHELGKHIKHRVAPKLDQHAACEVNSNNHLICPRLGAAVDFIITDENMREVADWVAENTPFDRLYFYGEDRPIHVSYGAEQKGEYIDLVLSASGHQVPKKRKAVTLYLATD